MPGSCRPPALKPGPTHLDPLPLALLWFPLQPGAELRLQLRAQLLHHQVAQDLEAGGTAGTGVGLCLGVLLSTEGQARPRGSLLPCSLALCSMSPLVSLLSIIPTGPSVSVWASYRLRGPTSGLCTRGLPVPNAIPLLPRLGTEVCVSICQMSVFPARQRGPGLRPSRSQRHPSPWSRAGEQNNKYLHLHDPPQLPLVQI